MEFKIYDGILDRNLIEQMRNLIFSLSDMKDKWNCFSEKTRRSLFRKMEEEPVPIEEAYGLRYPGEVLERYADRISSTEVARRSLAFALAEMKPLHTKTMFVGKQYDTFLSSIKKAAKSDVYLLGACYLLEESAQKKLEFRTELLERDYTDLTELLYCFYLFRDEPSLLGARKEKLAEMIGTKRNFTIYGNEELFAWLINYFYVDVRNMKGKKTNLLKAVVKLRQVNVEAKNPVKKWMQDCGYQEEEIVYLNMLMAAERGITGTRPSDITLERMALSACIRFLNGEIQRPEAVYGLCSKLLAKYQHYPVKLNGCTGLAESLKHKVKVQTPGAYMALFPYRSKLEQECFYFDLLDHKWDALQGLLGAEYERCVVDSLTGLAFSAEWFGKCIKRYQELTGIDLIRKIWSVSPYGVRGFFGKLVEYKIFDVVSLVTDYFQDYKDADTDKARSAVESKWNMMLEHLRHFLFLRRDKRLYTVLQMLDKQFGIEHVDAVFDSEEIFGRCFGIGRYYRFSDMKLFQKEFTLDENLQMLHLAEKYIYYNIPDRYLDFLANALMQLDCGEMPDIRLSAVAKQLLSKSKESIYNRESLIRKYYSREELAAYEEERKQAAQQMEKERKIMEAEALKKKFYQFVESHRQELPCAFYGLIERALWRDEEGLSEYVADYLCKEHGQGAVVLDEGNVEDFLRLMGKLYKWGKIPLDSVKEYLQRVEVCENV